MKDARGRKNISGIPLKRYIFRQLNGLVVLCLLLFTIFFSACGSNKLDKCHVEGCSNKHTTGYDGSLYCSTHKCEIVTCGNLKMEGSDYCRSHTCKKEGCFNKVSNVNRSYCADHVCHHTGCDDPVISGSRYCDEHTCAYEGCTNDVYYKGQMCEKHKGKGASSKQTPKAPSVPKTTTKPKKSSSGSEKTDPYNAKDYAHPDDFYYDHFDDFWDYEEAEDYWKDNQ